MPDISIVIPFYDEKETLPGLVSSLEAAFSRLGARVQVVFVDDGSTDGSADVLRSLPHPSFDAVLVRLSKNFGSHAALRAGIREAAGEWTGFLYADLQDPPDLVGRLHAKALEGHDIVWAFRERPEGSFFERNFSGAYAWLMRRFVSPAFPKNGFDVVLFNSKVKRELNEHIEAHSSVFLQILQLGFRQTSVSYARLRRSSGRSKWTLSKKLGLLFDSFISFSYAPIRWVTAAGAVLFAGGLLWALVIVCRALWVGDLQQGWPTLIAVLMTGFGVTNISLGIIAEYLWRTLDASRNRKVFVVDEVTRL